jgi:hypothetical protein
MTWRRAASPAGLLHRVPSLTAESAADAANAAVVVAHLFAAIASSERQCTPIRGDLVFGSSAVRAFHPMVSPMTIGRWSDLTPFLSGRGVSSAF